MSLQVSSATVTVDAIPYGTLQIADVSVTAVLQDAATLQVSSIEVSYAPPPVGTLQVSSISVGAAQPDPPFSYAGENVTGLEPWAAVTMTGTSTGANIVSYAWYQVSGPDVVLNDADTDTATYEAPGSLTGKDLVFGYVVINAFGLVSAESTVTHTVLPSTEFALVGGSLVPMRMLAVSTA